ncbi:phosphoethanolamine transferase [Dysgonomonas sp. 520]|uniref:phosphoethanolamine transferase n=1 Tax=Dysgonomonas sp. 520 TaxID=2302931 RepID=UPI0013D1DCE8|nr:phosphoethanolamine transferase [Dysgonomonas sp. 520]NDW08973.1 hypothetical protein [Dysgonomonas sp. 520]
MKFATEKLPVNFIILVLLSTLLITIFVVLDFNTYPIHNAKDVVYVAGQCALILVGSLSFVSVIALNRYVFALIYPSLILLCSVLGFYAWTMNTTLTVMILDATLHNDWETSSDLISVPLILTIILSLALSIVLVFYRFKRIEKIKYSYIIFCISLIFFIFFINTKSIERLIANHIPFNIYFVTKSYCNERSIISEDRPSLSANSFCNTDSLNVVFVIGESLRADHLPMNGYQRNTTPLLSTRNDIISLPNIYTPHTYTNKSLPDILTRADSVSPQLAYKERSFIDIFNACGFETSWLANQESAYSYVYFMHECDTLLFSSINKSSYVFDKWLDESLIPHFKNRMGTKASKKLVILHTIGSHWWYNSHFTDQTAKFQPIIKSKIITSNTPEEMINSYDNTIVYTDYFLFNLIKEMEDTNTIMIYLSDHGESLGENDIWLHASDSPPIHYPASFVWMSAKYKEKYPDKYSGLIMNHRKNYSSDFLFHSILDAATITSPYLKKDLSIFEKKEIMALDASYQKQP